MEKLAGLIKEYDDEGKMTIGGNIVSRICIFVNLKQNN